MEPAARRALLAALFREGLAAVDAGAAVRRALTSPTGSGDGPGPAIPADARVAVLAAGKAAAAMAAAAEDVASDRIGRGLVVTKDGHGLPLARCQLIEAGHPLPDERSAAAGRRALRFAAETGPEEVLLVLLSGGASALLSSPLPGLELSDLAGVTRALLDAGADIGETNAVRKHLGAVGGGRLARAASRAARVEVLVVSDVPGDRLDVVGSGPCVPDPTTWREVRDVVERRGIRSALSAAVRDRIDRGVAEGRDETPTARDPAFAHVRHHVVARNRDAIEAVRTAAAARGLEATLVTDALRGEAARAGRWLGALARAARGPRARCLLAGGETTVTVRGGGRGGRNQELALAAALELDGCPGIGVLAAGTDGTDGPTDAAGAFADAGTCARGASAGRDARADLAANDSYGFFRAEGGLFVTGPTRTNVMDLVLLIVDEGRPDSAAGYSSLP